MKVALRLPKFQPKSSDDLYFTLLVLLNVASQGLQGLLAPLTKELGADLGLGVQAIGELQALFLIVYAVFTPLWAFAAARFSRHRILVLISLLWGACCFGVTLTNDPFLFTLGFALAAVGNAAVVPLTFSMAIDIIEPQDRGFAFGWLSTGQTLSFGLAFLVGGFLGESFGWQLPFVVFGGLGAASALSLLIWKRYEPQHGAMDAELKELFARGEAYDYRIRPRDVRLLFRPISNLWILLASILNMIPTGAIGFWFIAMLRHDHGFSAADATGLMLALYFIQVPGAVLLGQVADWVTLQREDGRLRLLRRLTLLTLPCYLIGFLIPWETASLASPAYLLFLACVFAGAFFACALPPLSYSAVGDVNPPEKRGVMFSMINISRLVGRALGIQLVTLLAAWSGSMSGGMAWTAVVLVPAALCVVPVMRSYTADREALGGHFERRVAEQTTRAASREAA